MEIIPLTWHEKQENRKWWWHVLWKFLAPRKNKLFMWLILKDRVLTWDQISKRGTKGPRVCCLCMMEEEETIGHLFYNCNHSKHVWKGLSKEFQMEMFWEVGGIEENLKIQFEKYDY